MSYFDASQFDRDAVARLTEAKVQLTKENVLLKRQVETLTAQLAEASKKSAPQASNGPKSTASVTTAKLEADNATLRKEVVTMKRLFANAEEEHRRQLEAVVMEGIEHEERYRQLATLMDAKLVARDKKISEMRVAAPTHTAPPTTQTQIVDLEAATKASRLQSTLDEVIRIAQSALGTNVTPRAQRAASEIGSKRGRDESAVTDTPTVACSPLTVTATATSHHESDAKRRGRPPGKQSNAKQIAAAATEAKSQALKAAIRESLSNLPNASIGSAAPKRTTFGTDYVQEYLSLRKVASRGLEEARLAADLVAHCDGDMERLAIAFAMHLMMRCGPISARVAAGSAVLVVIEGILQVQGVVEPFLRAAWERGRATMSPEACHINHSSQLWALGYAIRRIVSDHGSNQPLSVASPTNHSAAIPSLMISDFLCAYLHARNRERSQQDVMYALPQLIAFLTGLVTPAGATEGRSLPEIVANAILHDIFTSASHDTMPQRDEYVTYYQQLCDHAGWLRVGRPDVATPESLLKALLAKLRLLTATCASTSPQMTVNAAQSLINALRPLIVCAGFSSLSTIAEAFANNSDANEVSLCDVSHACYVQIIAIAVVDFNISSSSPDWAAFYDLFEQYINQTTPNAPISVVHIFVCRAILHGMGDSPPGEITKKSLEMIRSFSRTHELVPPGELSAIMGSRLVRELGIK